MEPFMAEFFAKHAKGDKWVPFHCALGDHELYILERIWSMRYLSEKHRYALACGFSGSRHVPLFEETVLCCFPERGPATAEGLLLLSDPACGFRRGGPVHRRFDAYRQRGGKLHTACFSPRPVPRGAVGAEYTHYIMTRTATFFTMGLALAPKLLLARRSTRRLGGEGGGGEGGKDGGEGGGGGGGEGEDGGAGEGSGGESGGALANGSSALAYKGWEALDEELQRTKWVGPTLAKVFLVSTHLCLPHLELPHLELLGQGIEVGIGAQEAFKLLFPGIQAPKDYRTLPDRRAILRGLHAFLLRPEDTAGDTVAEKDGTGGGTGGGGGGGGGGEKKKRAAEGDAGGGGSGGGMCRIDALEPRLRPLISWCAAAARAKYRGQGVPAESFGDDLSLLALQVNLCEWRKFRNHCDPKRLVQRGMGAAAAARMPTEKKKQARAIQKPKPHGTKKAGEKAGEEVGEGPAAASKRQKRN